MGKIALAIFSHPDDAEFLCTGTLSLLNKAGWEIHIVTHAPGDKGTAKHDRKEISNIRVSEAQKSAEIISATYHCLDLEDLMIMYNRVNIHNTVSLMRKVRPSLVFTSSPSDYMMDHEMTSRIVQTACFSTGIRNLEIEEEPYEPVPFLYYCDPMEGKDVLGNLVIPSIYVDISEEIEKKEKMLTCHESQRNWLKEHHKMDEYIESMKRFSGQRGVEAGCSYAEGFRQHLGHGFPQENLLKNILGKKVIC